MPKATNQAKLVAALEARGYLRDNEARTTKYLTFKPGQVCKILLRLMDSEIAQHRIFVGKSGALRFSRKGLATESISFQATTTFALLAEGEAALQEKKNAAK